MKTYEVSEMSGSMSSFGGVHFDAIAARSSKGNKVGEKGKRQAARDEKYEENALSDARSQIV